MLSSTLVLMVDKGPTGPISEILRLFVRFERKRGRKYADIAAKAQWARQALCEWFAGYPTRGSLKERTIEKLCKSLGVEIVIRDRVREYTLFPIGGAETPMIMRPEGFESNCAEDKQAVI